MLCASHSVCWVHHQRKFQLDLPPYLRDFRATCSKSVTQASLPGDNRALEPPDSIPNSEVKRRIADGSVGFPHVRVGHRQALKYETPTRKLGGVFYYSAVKTILSVRTV